MSKIKGAIYILVILIIFLVAAIAVVYLRGDSIGSATSPTVELSETQNSETDSFSTDSPVTDDVQVKTEEDTDTDRSTESNLAQTEVYNTEPSGFHTSPTIVNVQSIEIDKEHETLAVGEKFELKVDIFPVGASNKTVSYSSSDRTVASVNTTTGTITAKKEGTTVITVTAADGGYTKECAVTVTLPKTGDSPYFLYVEKGSFTLTIYGKDSEGNYDHSKAIKSIRTAIGKDDLTPAGAFTLTTKERWYVWSTGAAAQYSFKYTGDPDRMIHSPVYKTTDIRQMFNDHYEPSKYGIGSKTTGGCLLMATGDAYWIYQNCPSGTTLYIVDGSPRGTKSEDPPKIKVAHQDPTDPLLK